MKKEKGKGFIKGAATIAAGGFLAKLIGALYRIPLTNLIGGQGLGLYQMVYPFYCLLLTVSATGIPSSIAALVAERYSQGETDEGVLKAAFRFFLTVGAVGTALMFLIAPLLVKAQGEPNLVKGYYALAPSVFLVSAISVFRGWFQGRNQMSPTAISETLEQLVKVGFGLLFAWFFKGNVYRAVAALLFAVTLSEGAAVLFMLFRFRRVPAPFVSLKPAPKITLKRLLSLSIPLTLNAGLIPLSGLIDSVMVVRLLSAQTENAVALYGLFSGGAVTVINLPVSVCYGIAAASIPAVAAAKFSARDARKKTAFSLFVTLLVSIPCAIVLFFFADFAVGIIFRSLSGWEKQTLVQLVKAFSVSAITLSCAQTLSACLTAQGKPLYAAISMAVGVAVKTLASFFLVRNPKFGIFGLAIATNLCYLLAFALDFVYNLYITKTKKRKIPQPK